MKSIQYTIRSIPAQVDKALRQEAKRSGKSLNEVIVSTLSASTGATGAHFTDLDAIFGAGIADEAAFCEAMDWQNNLPNSVFENRDA